MYLYVCAEGLGVSALAELLLLQSSDLGSDTSPVSVSSGVHVQQKDAHINKSKCVSVLQGRKDGSSAWSKPHPVSISLTVT